jgi:hypothetical protein
MNSELFKRFTKYDIGYETENIVKKLIKELKSS